MRRQLIPVAAGAANCANRNGSRRKNAFRPLRRSAGRRSFKAYRAVRGSGKRHNDARTKLRVAASQCSCPLMASRLRFGPVRTRTRFAMIFALCTGPRSHASTVIRIAPKTQKEPKYAAYPWHCAAPHARMLAIRSRNSSTPTAPGMISLPMMKVGVPVMLSALAIS